MSGTSPFRRDLKLASGFVAAPHHAFEVDGSSYLFATESLCVVRGDALTFEIMRRAEVAPICHDTFRPAGLVSDASAAAERIAELCSRQFLLAPGEVPVAAPVVEQGETVTFMVNVSQRCNLTCSYCYVNQGDFDYADKPAKKMNREMSETLASRVFALFPNHKNFGFHFYGGEPLMNFKEIRTICETSLKLARERGAGLQFYITTNGTLLDEEIADFFDRYRFIVYYSIDGEKDSHDRYRKYHDGSGSFDDVMRKYDILRSRHNVEIIGSSVIRQDLPLSEAIRFLEKCGVETCKAERVRLDDELTKDGLSGIDRTIYLRDTRELIHHYIDAIEKYRKPMDFRFTPKILQLLTKKRRKFFCGAGLHMFGVAANGELYPCALHVGRDHSLLGSLEDGLDRNRTAEFRRAYSCETQAGCKKCWARNLCGGGCSAMVDRFGHEDCEALRAEAEAAIVVFSHFAETDPLRLLALVDPSVVQWMNGTE